MASQKFKHKVIAIAGPPPDGLTIDKLKHWTEIHKGRFAHELDEHVTHLLCTKEQFKQRVPRGLKRKRLKIVDFDWFELSAGPGRVEKVAKYCHRHMLKKQEATRRERERIERGKFLAERFVNTNLYRVHYDDYNFRYQVSLVRENYLESGHRERHVLYLFESIARPPLFLFAAEYFRRNGDAQPAYFRQSDCSGLFDDEFGHFRRFFRAKTGIRWEDRVVLHGTMPASFFAYTPPNRGKPVGRNGLFSATMSRELNAALRGLPALAVGEQLGRDDEEVGTEAVGDAMLQEEGDYDKDDDKDDGVDWSLINAKDASDLESGGVEMEWSDSEDQDDLEILGDSPNTSSSDEEGKMGLCFELPSDDDDDKGVRMGDMAALDED